jgi:CDGSH-type Zn-finger protein
MTDKPRIIIKLNGPILVQGDVELLDQDGNVLVPPPAKTPGTFKLCKCGRSGTKPFCDATHNKPLEEAEAPSASSQ